MGSEHVEGVNAISGERCSPHPHVYSDRVLRPGDPAYFDILHSYMGYRTCYYRTFAVGSASQALVDAYKRCRFILDAAIAKIRPGVTTDEVVSVWPKAQEFGFPERGGRVRAAVRARCRPLDLGEADHLAAGLDRASRGDRGGHGVRARDLLALHRRLVRGADRGAARRHRRRLRGDHALPRRGPDDRRSRATTTPRTASSRASARSTPRPTPRARRADQRIAARGTGHRVRPMSERAQHAPARPGPPVSSPFT